MRHPFPILILIALLLTTLYRALPLRLETPQVESPAEAAPSADRTLGEPTSGADASRRPLPVPRRVPARVANAHLVRLPEVEGASPRGAGLEAWRLYYDEFDVDGVFVSRRGMWWWTEDPEIVDLFLELWPAELDRNQRHLEQYWRERGPLGRGVQDLGESLDALAADAGTLAALEEWFRTRELDEGSSHALASFLRAQAHNADRAAGQEVGADSMFGEFMKPLERHLDQEFDQDFLTLPRSDQAYAREAYAQALLDAAEQYPRFQEIHAAVRTASAELGLPPPDPNGDLAHAIPELRELRQDLAAIWAEFLRDLERLR